jgi:Zn-dependent protease with chaperone function
MSGYLSRTIAVGLLAGLVLVAPAAARDTEGVKVGHMAIVRNLTSAEGLEKQAITQYDALKRKAQMQRALLADDHPQVKRLRAIAADLLPHANKFNPRAKDWAWEINIINSPGTINAFCMPGGKIAFFTGIIEKLQLTDDEIALIMGHEIAHALREHARERAAKQMITNIGVLAISIFTGSNAAGQLASVGGALLGRRFSRSDETEADLIGMELAARAAYDPRSGVSLWTKMSAANKGAPPQWLSTHPSSDTRIDVIKKNLKDVMPLYEKARAARGR